MCRNIGKKALWENNYSWDGFEWRDADNNEQSIISYVRKGKSEKDDLLCILNFTPTTYEDYCVGVSKDGNYVEIFNSDDELYGGSGKLNKEVIKSEKGDCHGQKYLIRLTIPPLAGIVLRRKAKHTFKEFMTQTI